MVLTAGYILWMIQRAMFGERPEHHNKLTDASIPEMIPIAILIVSIIGVGIYPSIISDIFVGGIEPIVEALN